MYQNTVLGKERLRLMTLIIFNCPTFLDFLQIKLNVCVKHVHTHTFMQSVSSIMSIDFISSSQDSENDEI